MGWSRVPAVSLPITDFLLARYAEDEAVAREAMTEIDRARYLATVDVEALRNSSRLSIGDRMDEVVATPGRVLADIDAKRRILARHQEYVGPVVAGRGEIMSYGCNECVADGWADAESHEESCAPWPCPTIRALATVYADHPDYQPEWSL